MSSLDGTPSPKSSDAESELKPHLISDARTGPDWNKHLVEHSHDLLCIHDLEGRLLSVNPEPARQMGYAVEEILRTPMRELVPPEFRPQFDEYLKMIAREGHAHGLISVLTRSGKRRVWEYHNTLRTDGTAAPVVFGVAHDVTEQRRIERDLRKTADGFRVLEEYAPALAMFDREMRYLYASRRWRTDYGLGDRDLRGVSHYDVFSELPERWKQLHRRGLAGEVLREENDRFDRADGSTQWIRWEVRPWYETADVIGGIAIFAEDVTSITERKRAVASLEESEKRLRAIHERAPAGIALVDARSGRFLQVNPKLCEIAGRTADEMLQLSYQDITHPEDQADSAARIKQLLEERVRAYDAEKRYVRSDGTVVLVNLSVVPMWGPGEEPRCLVTIVQDITERKRAEERLREFERVVEHLEEMIAVVNRDYRYVIANRAFLSYRGMTKEQVVGRLAAEVLNPEALATVVKEKLDEAFRGRVVTYEMRYRYPEKGDKDLSVTYLPVEGPAGIDRVAAVIRDITERKQAEQALQKSAAELREAQRLGRLGSWYRDLRTDTLVWSEQLYCVLGSDPDAKPLTFAQTERFFTPESWQRLSQANQALLSTGGTDELEVEFRRQDGTVGWAIMHREAVRDEAGKIVGIRGVALDITERRRAEEALRESEERMRLAQEAAKIGCFERNMRTGEAHWTPQTEEMFGLQPGTGPKSIPEFLSLIHPADRQHVEDLFAESVATGRGAGEWRVIWPDGSVHWIDGRWKVFKDQQGTPLRAIGIDSDITERKRVEDELRQAKEKLTEEKLYLEQTFDTEMGFEEIIGQSQGLKTVMEMVTRVAASDATVLLLGETGTGKELVARALHRLSRRGASSFVKMNCAAIPSGLLESELFGAEKGAYTGAVNRKIGRLELADNGTLFLDEIGEIALALQPKLLCVLQDQEFERLGGTQTLKVNFRLIAATNRNLAESVRHNEFRSDLYYRLNVFPIRVPPLRERRDDIPLLVEHFVRKYARRMSKSITSIPRKTMNALAAWDWPGNVRELENFLERSVILTNGSVLAAPLSELQPASSTRAQAETLEAAERKHILEALRLSKGRISGEHGAAARLGLKRTTLQSKLKHMHINPQKPPTR